MDMILTTRGERAEDTLDRTWGIKECGDHLVLWIEWRDKTDAALIRRDAFKGGHEHGDMVWTIKGWLPRGLLEYRITTAESDNEYVIKTTWRERTKDEMLRDDVWVVLKRAGVTADSVAGGFS